MHRDDGAERRQLLHGRGVRRTIGLLGELLEVPARQCVDRLADERREGGVGRAHASRRVEDDHAVAGGVEVVLEVQRHRGVGRGQPRVGGCRGYDMLDSIESGPPRRHGTGVHSIFPPRRRIPHASLPTRESHAGQDRTGAPARHAPTAPRATRRARPRLTDDHVERNPGTALDLDIVRALRVNRSAVERRAATIPTRRTVKKEWQAAWLLRAITLIDLTTLAGDDTPGNVRRLCAKAAHPLRQDLVDALGVADLRLTTGAVCVYHALVPDRGRGAARDGHSRSPR